MGAETRYYTELHEAAYQHIIIPHMHDFTDLKNTRSSCAMQEPLFH